MLTISKIAFNSNGFLVFEFKENTILGELMKVFGVNVFKLVLAYSCIYKKFLAKDMIRKLLFQLSLF